MSSRPTVPHRLFRLLMLWFVIALQATPPFVHAHAAPLQAGHAASLHGHADAPNDAAGRLAENRERGAEVEGAPSRARQAAPWAAEADASYPVPALPLAAAAGREGSAWRAAPLPRAVLSDHALPYALAPPRR